MPDIRLEATINGRKVSRPAKPEPTLVGFPARRPAPHRQQGRLRRRRMRHLLGVRRWRADEIVPAAGGQGARGEDRDHRVAGQDRRVERAAARLPPGRRQPVRLLHPRHGDGGDRGAARQSVRRPGRDQRTARRQHLPLHRLSEDFRRGRNGARRAERPSAGDRVRGGRSGSRRLHRQGRAPHRRAQQGFRPAQICRRHDHARHAACAGAALAARSCPHRVDRHFRRGGYGGRRGRDHIGRRARRGRLRRFRQRPADHGTRQGALCG